MDVRKYIENEEEINNESNITVANYSSSSNNSHYFFQNIQKKKYSDALNEENCSSDEGNYSESSNQTRTLRNSAYKRKIKQRKTIYFPLSKFKPVILKRHNFSDISFKKKPDFNSQFSRNRIFDHKSYSIFVRDKGRTNMHSNHLVTNDFQKEFIQTNQIDSLYPRKVSEPVDHKNSFNREMHSERKPYIERSVPFLNKPQFKIYQSENKLEEKNNEKEEIKSNKVFSISYNENILLPHRRVTPKFGGN